MALGGHAKRDGTRRHLKEVMIGRGGDKPPPHAPAAGMCTRKCCQLKITRPIAGPDGWDGPDSISMWPRQISRDAAPNALEVVQWLHVCLHEMKVQSSRGVLRQHVYRCFLIRSASFSLICVGRPCTVRLAHARANPSSERAPASAAARRCAYPQHNHNITCLGGSTCSQRSKYRSFPTSPPTTDKRADITHTPRGEREV